MALTGKLTQQFVDTVSEPGRHSDGRNLYLRITASESATPGAGTLPPASWTFLWKERGQVFEIGLGSARGSGRAGIVSLASARRNALAMQKQIGEGINPALERRKNRAATVPTLAECAEQYIVARDATWTPDHARTYRRSFTKHLKVLANKRVNAITTDEVVAAIRQLWSTNRVSAKRIINRLEAVLDYAATKGYRDPKEPNPGRWIGNLQHVLPKPARGEDTVQHFAAMPYADVAQFLSRVAGDTRIQCRALEFLILTAARTGEIYKARWSEIDFDTRIWNIPKPHKKQRREHAVPLSGKAIAILNALPRPTDNDHVFPGRARNGALNTRAMDYAAKDNGATAYTIHGFRSSFRDWAGDETHTERDVVEAALSHPPQDPTEAAYRRGTALKKRRTLMETWANYIYPEAEARPKIVPMQGRSG